MLRGYSAPKQVSSLPHLRQVPQPLFITFLLKTRTIVLAIEYTPNYYVFIRVRAIVLMSSKAMLDKKRIHHALVAGDVERFLAAGGAITEVGERDSQQAESDFYFATEKKRKYGRRIKNDKRRAANSRILTFKSL